MVTVANSRREEILRWLDEVKDPEVPVLSIRELGVLRDVEVTPDEVVDVLGMSGDARDGDRGPRDTRAPRRA